MNRHRSDIEAIRRIKGTVGRVEANPYAFGAGPRQPRLGGASQVLWCQLTSALNPATGTWPSITPTSVTGQTIYRLQRGQLVALPGTWTVYNVYPAQFLTGKTTAVSACGDGTFQVIDQNC